MSLFSSSSSKRKRTSKEEETTPESEGILLLLPPEVVMYTFGEYLNPQDLRNLSLVGNKILLDLVNAPSVWKRLVERREKKDDMREEDRLEKNWKEEFRKGMFKYFELLNTWQAHPSNVPRIVDVNIFDIGKGLFVCGSGIDKKFKVWELVSGKYLYTTVLDEYGSIYEMIIYNGLFVGSVRMSDEYSLIKMWDPKTGKCVKTFNVDQNYGCSSICVFNDFIASGCGSGKIKLWDPTTGECVKVFDIRFDGGSIKDLVVIDGKLVSIDTNIFSPEILRVWDVENGTCDIVGELKYPWLPLPMKVNRDIVSLNANDILINHEKQDYDFEKMKEAHGASTQHPTGLCAFGDTIIRTPNDRNIISWDQDGRVKVWDPFFSNEKGNEYKCIKTLHKNEITFYSDGTEIPIYLRRDMISDVLLIGNKLIVAKVSGKIDIWGVKDLDS